MLSIALCCLLSYSGKRLRIGMHCKERRGSLHSLPVRRGCAQHDGYQEAPWIILLYEGDPIRIRRLQLFPDYVDRAFHFPYNPTPYGMSPSGYGACFGSRISMVRVHSSRLSGLYHIAARTSLISGEVPASGAFDSRTPFSYHCLYGNRSPGSIHDNVDRIHCSGNTHHRSPNRRLCHLLHLCQALRIQRTIDHPHVLRRPSACRCRSWPTFFFPSAARHLLPPHFPTAENTANPPPNNRPPTPSPPLHSTAQKAAPRTSGHASERHTCKHLLP